MVALLGWDWIHHRALEAGNRGTDELPEPTERDAPPRDFCGSLRRLLVLPRGTEVRAPALVRQPGITVARQAGQERHTTRRRRLCVGLNRPRVRGRADRHTRGRGCGTRAHELRARVRRRLLARQTDRRATRFRRWRLGQSTRIGPSVRNADLRQLGRRRRCRGLLERLAGDQRQSCEREHADEHASSGAMSKDPAHGPPVRSWDRTRQDPRPLPSLIGTLGGDLERPPGTQPRRSRPSPGQMPISSDRVIERRKGRALRAVGSSRRSRFREQSGLSTLPPILATCHRHGP